MLRPKIEFYASGPISESKEKVEQSISDFAPLIGFSTDSLAMVTMRKQHLEYVKLLQDTLENKMYPSSFNETGTHIQSWETVIAPPKKGQRFYGDIDQLFENTGRLKIQQSNVGKVIRILEHPGNPNPTFLKGDSLLGIASHLLGNTLGYNLDQYELAESGFESSSIEIDERENQRRIIDNGSEPESLKIIWERKQNVTGTPSRLVLNLQPVVRELNNEEGFRTEFGFSIESFAALDEFEPLELQSGSLEETDDDLLVSYLLFGVLFVLVILVFSIGIRNVFKGKAEWRRALFMFAVVSVTIYGWRMIFFMNSYNPLLSTAGVFNATINNLLLALVVGLYAAFAYISWEALARSQKQSQVDLIDALWQRKFFVKETGASLVHGFAIGGIIIGVIASLLFYMGEFLIQADSQFGFTEPSITPRLLTINMSAWVTTWLVCIAQIGFVYVIFKHWVKKEWLASILSIFFAGLCISVIGRLIGTSGTIFQDLAIYMGVAVICIYAIREFGLLTVSTGWWIFTVFFMIQPYWESPSVEVAYVGWIQAIFMAGPLIYGFIAYKYGVPVSEVGDYIPEYEERITQHLRVEKEIEIARESQYKLMPLQPPKADGFDVYGFFLPSFEVGGDFFDYVISENTNGIPIALTMAVVDVSGKAMRAAMPAVFTSGLLLSRMKDDMPDKVLSQISEPVFSRTDKRTFITCALARYDLETMKMSIANAGHCRPILKRNGLAEFIPTPAPAYPLGLQRDVMYKAETIAMKKGDFFLLYSDGLPEAVNDKGERFGFEEVPRLIESIDTETLSAHEIAQEIKRTVQKFSNYQLADDTTIICLKV